MSNALAIAGVTAVLEDLLNDGLLNADFADSMTFEVTAKPPERLAREEENGTAESPRLNLYLYRVTPNTGWINERMPSRSSSGRRLSNPYLALDLCYLLSAYGLQDLQAEILLGYGMQLLHEMPVLSRQRIRDSLTPAHPDASLLPPPFSLLDAEELADQIEQIRISPHWHDTEEMSRLWSSLNSGLRPSALYKVTVALIESRRSTAMGPPVKHRRIFNRPLNQPRITSVLSNPAPADPQSVAKAGLIITHGHRLTLVGSGLRGELTRVRAGSDLLQGPALLEATDQRLTFDIPADFRPGLVAVQVEHHLRKDEAEPPAEPQPEPPAPPVTSVGTLAFETSNTAAFMLAPSFGAAPSLQGALPADPTEPVTGTVRLTFAHGVGRDQTVEMLLDEVDATPAPDRDPWSFTFTAGPAQAGDAPTLWDVPITDVGRAIYLVRARVDGAVSEVGFAQGVADPDIQNLGDAGIYSDPALNLGTP